MTAPPPAWPTVGRCRCGRLEVEHKIRRMAAGSPDLTRGGTDDGTCAVYVGASREERPPASELRRRLGEILLLHLRGDDGNCEACCAAWRCPTVRIVEGGT